jgi:hypothetical protein
MRIPKFEDPEVTKFLEQWTKEQEKMINDRLSAITGNRSLLLISPGLKVWEATISDAGALTWTKVAG